MYGGENGYLGKREKIFDVKKENGGEFSVFLGRLSDLKVTTEEGSHTKKKRGFAGI